MYRIIKETYCHKHHDGYHIDVYNVTYDNLEYLKQITQYLIRIIGEWKIGNKLIIYPNQRYNIVSEAIWQNIRKAYHLVSTYLQNSNDNIREWYIIPSTQEIVEVFFYLPSRRWKLKQFLPSIREEGQLSTGYDSQLDDIVIYDHNNTRITLHPNDVIIRHNNGNIKVVSFVKFKNMNYQQLTSMGVGNGNGCHFVFGDRESIKELQRKLLR